MAPHSVRTSELTPLRTVFFAVAVGVFIFNIFASQMLIADIASGLGLRATHANFVPTIIALGYALGLLLIVPLADVVENRSLVISMAVSCAAAQLLAAMTHQAIAFLALCFVIGAASSLIQILVPLVGSLTSLVSDAVVIGALLLALVSGGVLGRAAPSLGVAGLVAAAILLDCGVVGDQTLGRRAINMLEASAIGRRNGIFVSIFFSGGAAGSAVVGPMSSLGGWSGVCVAGAAFGVGALSSRPSSHAARRAALRRHGRRMTKRLSDPCVPRRANPRSE